MYMPQMSKLPFMFMSAILITFFLMWITKVWFNSHSSNNIKKNVKSSLNTFNKSWPL